MPEISVIVPVYNVESYIHRCINSILNQTFSDFELILVDDGSPDNCGKICDEYAEKDNRVHVIHQKNAGLSAARNAGIDWSVANSNSNWLVFIDSDDWIHPVMLEKLYNANELNNTKVSSCSFERTNGDEPTINLNEINSYVTTPEKFFLENNVTATIACAKLYNKECFESLRYPVGKIHEDEFTTYKILFSYASVSVIDAPLYMYYQNDEGIMLSKWNPKRLYALDALNEQIEYFQNKLLYEIASDRANAYFNLCKINFDAVSKDNNHDFIKKVQTKLRYGLNKYKKLCKIKIKTHAYLYEIAYPNFMKLYWLIKVVLNKLNVNK